MDRPCFVHGLNTRPIIVCADMPRRADIGLYRDVWIAAIASSRTRLATLTGAMCKTSQCELRSLRVNSGMLNVIRIVTYYTLPPLESPDSFWIAMAISRDKGLCPYFPYATAARGDCGRRVCARTGALTFLLFFGGNHCFLLRCSHFSSCKT